MKASLPDIPVFDLRALFPTAVTLIYALLYLLRTLHQTGLARLPGHRHSPAQGLLVALFFLELIALRTIRGHIVRYANSLPK